MLSPPVCVGVSDYCPVYSDVVVITKVQELLSGELGAIVSDDRIGDPKAKNNVSNKAYRLFRANYGHKLSLDPLNELVDCDKQVGEAPKSVLKGPKRSKPHTTKGHVMGMVWSSWASVWTCLTKYWHPLQDLTI
jgi:hypothetical protein